MGSVATAKEAAATVAVAMDSAAPARVVVATVEAVTRVGAVGAEAREALCGALLVVMVRAEVARVVVAMDSVATAMEAAATAAAATDPAAMVWEVVATARAEVARAAAAMDSAATAMGRAEAARVAAA